MSALVAWRQHTLQGVICLSEVAALQMQARNRSRTCIHVGNRSRKVKTARVTEAP